MLLSYMQIGANLPGRTHTPHVHVAIHDVCGCLSAELGMAIVAGVCYEVAQLVNGYGCLQPVVLGSEHLLSAVQHGGAVCKKSQEVAGLVHISMADATSGRVQRVPVRRFGHAHSAGTTDAVPASCLWPLLPCPAPGRSDRTCANTTIKSTNRPGYAKL